MPADLKTQMLERLIDTGDWLRRHELMHELTTSPVAAEDALADLVVDGKAEYQANKGYRLAGGVQARRAAWLMRRRRVARSVFAEPVGKEYRVGVAELQRLGPQQELSLVMFELAMPLATDLDEHLAQVRAVQDFSMRETANG